MTATEADSRKWGMVASVATTLLFTQAAVQGVVATGLFLAAATAICGLAVVLPSDATVST